MLTSVNDGLDTRSVFATPAPAAMPLAKTVFPAPSSPVIRTISFPLNPEASSLARRNVSSSERVVRTLARARPSFSGPRLQGRREITDEVAGRDRSLAELFGGDIAGQAVNENSRKDGPEEVLFLDDLRGDEAAEDVPRTAGGHAGVPRRVDEDAAVGRRDERAIPLEDDRDAVFRGEFGNELEAVLEHLGRGAPGEPGELPGMRSEDGGRRKTAQDIRVRGDDVESIGVDDGRDPDLGEKAVDEPGGRRMGGKPGPEKHGVLPPEETERPGQGLDGYRLLGCFRERLGHELGHGPGDDRKGAFGRGHRDQAGPHPQRGPSRERRRARHPDRPGDDEDVAVGALVSVRFRLPKNGRTVLPSTSSSFSSGLVEKRGRDADRGHDEVADGSGRGREDVGDLGGRQGDRQVRLDAGPDQLEGVVEESPDGISTATLNAARRVDIPDGQGEEPVERLEEAGPEQRVDDDGRVKDPDPRLLPFGGSADLGDRDARA